MRAEGVDLVTIANQFADAMLKMIFPGWLLSC
jgi:hypothetical protein